MFYQTFFESENNIEINDETIESFDTFSPYTGNNSYPFVYLKERDNKLLKKTLKKWEQPFNCNDEGYWNAEPRGDPPLVPIVAYNTMREVGLEPNPN